MDLGKLMLSLCYLPTAGRLTVTVIKARNLKAMDITGSSGKFAPGPSIIKRNTCAAKMSTAVSPLFILHDAARVLICK